MSSRKRSEVWNHFSEIDHNKAKCGYCSQIISAKGGSTGNLTRHMRLKHVGIAIYQARDCTRSRSPARENNQSGPSTSHSDNNQPGPGTSHSTDEQNTNIPTSSKMQKKQSAINEYLTSTKPVSINKSKQFDEQLVKMIVKEYHPFRIVEDVEFKKFVKLLCPGYNLPSRKTISTSLIPKLFISTKEKVQDKIKEAFAVCITTDGWTSLNNESFLAITAHWLNENTQLCSNLLGCVVFNQRHTAENLSNLLTQTFEEWNIQNKIVVVVSDNAANITAAIRLGGWRHLGCFAHSLNLIVQAGLKDIQTTVNKIRRIVEFFKRSSHALAKLHQIQEQMGLPALKLKQDVATRWNSTYDMLSRIIKIKDAVVSTLAIISHEDINTLTQNEWLVAEKSLDVLSIFNDITNEVSSEKNVSISKVMLFTHAMKIHLEKHSIQTSLPELHHMIDTFLKQISSRFKDIENNELITQPTILDPRFKKYGFYNLTKFDAAYASLKQKVCAVNMINAGSATHSQTSADKNALADPISTSLLWKEFDEQVVKAKALTNPTAAGIVELDKYLNEPLINRLQDPLIWWKHRKEVYPMLYEIVKKRLCIVATSVPCERIFSKAGQIATEKRSRLTSSKISEILFLNHNLE